MADDDYSFFRRPQNESELRAYKNCALNLCVSLGSAVIWLAFANYVEYELTKDYMQLFSVANAAWAAWNLPRGLAYLVTDDSAVKASLKKSIDDTVDKGQDDI